MARAGDELVNPAPRTTGPDHIHPLQERARPLARLKADGGPELHVLGSRQLIRTLAAHGLVDEYRLWLFPAAAPLEEAA